MAGHWATSNITTGSQIVENANAGGASQSRSQTTYESFRRADVEVPPATTESGEPRLRLPTFAVQAADWRFVQQPPGVSHRKTSSEAEGARAAASPARV
jgi:hypothetical protein